MTDLTELLVALGLIYLTLKGIIACWFISGVLTIVLLIFASPLLTLFGFIKLF